MLENGIVSAILQGVTAFRIVIHFLGVNEKILLLKWATLYVLTIDFKTDG